MRFTNTPANIRIGAVNIVGRRASERAIGGSLLGTKKEEKQNFLVRFLHTMFRNQLIMFRYPASPSWALWLS